MDLFTLIGMLLSVFGAAYSANAALRSHFEEEIRDGAREANNKVRFIKENDTATHAHAAAEKYERTINRAQFWWSLSHWIPIIIFSFTSFLLSLCVVISATPRDCSAMWGWGKWVLLIIVGINILCFLVAGGSYRQFMHANLPLTGDFNSCQERKNKSAAAKDIEKSTG